MFNGNYYNPYMFQVAGRTGNLANTGLGIKGLFKGFNFSNFLTSTGKTLNVINQAIPIFYQVRPIINNAKTMFKVAGAIRSSDRQSNLPSKITNSVSNNNSVNSYHSVNSSNLNYLDNNIKLQENPVFFL